MAHRPGTMRYLDRDLGEPELIAFDLDDDERYILRRGIVEWGGPAYPTEELAIAMGFSGVRDLLADGKRLHEAVEAGRPLSRTDWFRVVLATEIAFASDLVGSGRDWSITTGVSDEHSLRTLRGIQRKVTREIRRVAGNGVGTLPNKG